MNKFDRQANKAVQAWIQSVLDLRQISPGDLVELTTKLKALSDAKQNMDHRLAQWAALLKSKDGTAYPTAIVMRPDVFSQMVDACAHAQNILLTYSTELFEELPEDWLISILIHLRGGAGE